MKRNTAHFMLTVCLLVGSAAFSARANLGLQQSLTEQGVTAVGQAVRMAVKAIYASTEDPQLIQDQIVAIINEAVATDNGEAVRYTLIAVMLAGGDENLDLSKTAIDNSAAFYSFPDITATTVTTGSSLVAAMGSGAAGGAVSGDSGGGEKALGGGAEELGGGKKAMGGGAGFSGGEKELGGGYDENPFDDGDDSVIDDDDVVPTTV